MSGTGGGGGCGSGAWTLVGAERKQDSPDSGCPTEGCVGCMFAKTSSTRRCLANTVSATATTLRRAKNFNINMRHWNSGDNGRLCEWCEGDTVDSPLIGVPNDGADSSTKRESLVCVRIYSYLCIFVIAPATVMWASELDRRRVTGMPGLKCPHQGPFRYLKCVAEPLRSG